MCAREPARQFLHCTFDSRHIYRFGVRPNSFENSIDVTWHWLWFSPPAMNPRAHRVQTTATATDPLFADLDGRMVATGSEPWSVRVLGIHARGGEFWVQCSPPQGALSGPVLRLSGRATAQHAVAALEAWVALPPSSRPDMVDVMRVTRHAEGPGSDESYRAPIQ